MVRYFHVALVLILLGTNSAFAADQDSLKCNMQIILQTEDHLDSLSMDEMLLFLDSFGEACRNNAEFSECSNAVLFDVLMHKPALFCEALNRNKSQLDVAYIFLNLENPVSDLIDLERIRVIIRQVEIESELKKKLLEALAEH